MVTLALARSYVRVRDYHFVVEMATNSANDHSLPYELSIIGHNCLAIHIIARRINFMQFVCLCCERLEPILVDHLK